MKYVKITEKKTKYSSLRLGVIILDEDDYIRAIYVKPHTDDNEMSFYIRTLDKKDFHIEECEKKTVEKLFQMATYDIDRKIDSLTFDMDELKSDKKKVNKYLKMAQ